MFMEWLRTDLCAVAELGNEGWDWDGLEPYYKKVQICLKYNKSHAYDFLGCPNDPTRC